MPLTAMLLIGTQPPWNFNAGERRHLYPLETLYEMRTRLGFKTDGGGCCRTEILNSLLLTRKPGRALEPRVRSQSESQIFETEVPVQA